MVAFDDDDKPKKKLVHEIGQDLTLLSANELTERIALLKDDLAELGVRVQWDGQQYKPEHPDPGSGEARND